MSERVFLLSEYLFKKMFHSKASKNGHNNFFKIDMMIDYAGIGSGSNH